MLTILFLAACGPGPTAQATTTTASGTPPAIPPSLSPAFTPTHSPEPSLREGPFRLVASVPEDAVEALGTDVALILRDGEVELLGEDILLRLAGFGWETALRDFPGAPMGIDRAGRLWVVPLGGEAISVWDNEAWVMYAAESGWEPLAEPRADLTTDPAGGIWLATGQDVRVFDGDLWTIFSPSHMGLRLPRGDTMSAFSLEFASATETVWVGECDLAGPGPVGGRGVRWWDGGEWHRGPSAEGCALAIDEAPSGEIWVGVDDRLWAYDPADRNWSAIELSGLSQDERAGPFILDLTFGPRGDPWVLVAVCGGASCSGNELLLTRDDDAWVTVGEAGEFVSPPTFDGRGTPWLPTSTGVYRIRNHDVDPVADLNVLSSAVDDEGRLWLTAWRQGELELWVQAP